MKSLAGRDQDELQFNMTLIIFDNDNIYIYIYIYMHFLHYDQANNQRLVAKVDFTINLKRLI